MQSAISYKWSVTDLQAEDGRITSAKYYVTAQADDLSVDTEGNWFFEGTFPVVLTDWDGKIIAQGYAKANPPAGKDWMTTDYVPFSATISYILPPDTPYRTGFLILKKDNPSGEPQFDNSLEIKITL